MVALCLSLGRTPNIDEAGYYLPLVKWIESNPVVPGTALLNHRIGFNSGFHMLSAVFGIHGFIEGGVYKLNGLLFIVFNFYFLRRLIKMFSFKNLSIADLLLSGALIFQFSFLLDSMDSDYIGIMGAILVIAWSLEILQKEVTRAEVLTLFIIGLFLFTIRPFNAFLLAAPIWLIFSRSSQRKYFFYYLLTGSLLVAPWFIRNYFLTGYLIFPIYFIDFFNPEWKVPSYVALASHDIISEFAKLEIVRPEYLYDSMTDPRLNEWIPLWIHRVWSMLIGKVVLILVPLSGLLILFSAIRKANSGITKSDLFYLLYSIPIIAIWFFNYPSIRFGWAWILFLICGGGFLFWKLTRLSNKLLVTFIAIIVCLSWLRLIINLDKSNLLENTFRPIPTKTNYPYKEIVKGELVLKYSVDPYCHGLAPPCLPFNNNLDIVQRGATLQDGFKLSEN